MKCLRCGHCCKYYLSVVVDNPALGISEGNIISNLGDGTSCKHLRGDKPGEYSCDVHHFDWYKETPCYAHCQVGKDDEPCRIGKYVLGIK